MNIHFCRTTTHKKLNLTNCILTAYALKTNQKTLYDDVKDIDVLKEIEKENYAEDVEKSHSKIITRKYYITSKIFWLKNKEKWEKLKSIGVEKKQF